MSERSRPITIPATASAAERLPRCCPAHPDWTTLSEHLVDEFPEIAIGDIVREVSRAKDAVDQVSLDLDEALSVGELIVRHQLLMLAGHVQEVARLDPERHTRRDLSRSQAK
ncbi:MAG: hypothetical protein QOC82_2423 [Frankiaceae bacterium]|nr:hypothetical protein [Frankiaceae bacterium]